MAVETTVAERLGEFAATLALDDVPAAVRDRASDLIAYGLMVAAAGRSTGFGAQAESAAGQDAGGARSLQSGRRLAAPAAAFVNGSLMQARGQEDTHGTFHAGATVLPAALAVAEERGADAERLRAAVVVGYEVGIALSERLTPFSTPPHRATSVYGPVAAAAAAGHLLELDGRGMATALAMASAFSGGTTEWAAAGTEEARFQGGWASMSGVLAARLAAAGITGSPGAFEGRGGFFDCYAPAAPAADRADLGTRLGRDWGILDVTFKQFPVCAFNQSACLAAVRIATEADLAPDAVEHVSVAMTTREATYAGVDFGGPFARLEQTQMSVRLAVAGALTHRRLLLADVLPDAAPSLDRLIDATTVIPVDGWIGKRARVQVHTSDGHVLTHAVDDPLSEFSWDRAAVRAHVAALAQESHLAAHGAGGLIDAATNDDAATILDVYWEGS